MQNKGLKYYLIKCLVFILSFQILNLSVHSGAQLSEIVDNSHTIGSYNQIDCFVEYFYEDICLLDGYNDYYDTSLHNKQENTHKFITKYIDIQLPEKRICSVVDPNAQKSTEKQNHFPLWENQYNYLFSKEIKLPPQNTFLV